MGRFVKGNVVVMPFPFSDLSGSKRRPALVLADLDGDDILLPYSRPLGASYGRRKNKGCVGYKHKRILYEKSVLYFWSSSERVFSGKRSVVRFATTSACAKARASNGGASRTSGGEYAGRTNGANASRTRGGDRGAGG
jgi:hypothetical protein